MSPRNPYDFGAGKRPDLLRMKLYARKFGFEFHEEPAIVAFIPRTRILPGNILLCEHCQDTPRLLSIRAGTTSGIFLAYTQKVNRNCERERSNMVGRSELRGHALEEHYWDQEVVAYFKENPIGNTETSKRLYDLANMRLREMDKAGIDIQILSHASPLRADVAQRRPLSKVTRRLMTGLQAPSTPIPNALPHFATLPTGRPVRGCGRIGENSQQARFQRVP